MDRIQVTVSIISLFSECNYESTHNILQERQEQESDVFELDRLRCCYDYSKISPQDEERSDESCRAILLIAFSLPEIVVKTLPTRVCTAHVHHD